VKRNAAQLKYQRERRKKARAEGLCAVCCIRKPQEGYANCDKCRGVGQVATPAHPYCIDCLAYHPRRKHIARWRRLWRAA